MNAVKFLPGEKVILKLRKHWIILARDAVGTAVVLFVPFILIGILQAFIPGFDVSRYFVYGAFASALWSLVVWLALAVIVTEYYLDLWIVTDRRVVSVDQHGLFNRKVTTLGHDRIQEIIVKEENVMQAFFKYGTLDIETASPTDGDATMEGIPDPERVRRVILDQQAKKTTLPSV